MFHRIEKTAWGCRIARIDNNNCISYVKSIKSDGTYIFHGDYLFAKMFSEKTAKKHLEILEGGKA